jgi:hypothetical protein
LNLPNENPDEEMIVLQYVSGDSFKRVRKDKTLAERSGLKGTAWGK